MRLPSRRTINVFFYDGPISRAVAFEGLLNDGKVFADRLIGGFSDATDWPQLSHIATDGESYGHHHRYGEMALTAALDRIETNKLAELTNYGQFLERHPANHFVEIFPNTSWSCVHGIERWLAQQLRLQFRRPPGVESRMARAFEVGARLASRCTGARLRNERRLRF